MPIQWPLSDFLSDILQDSGIYALEGTSVYPPFSPLELRKACAESPPMTPFEAGQAGRLV